MSIDLDRLRRDLVEHAEYVVITLLGDPMDRSRGELRYGRKGSLAVVIAGAKAGMWHDHEAGNGGDLLALIEREQRCDFMHAVDVAEKMLARTYAEARPNLVYNKKTVVHDDRRKLALAIFGDTQQLTGSIGESYLAKRGIDLDALPDLDGAVRFHPRCPFRTVHHPCVVALFRNIISDKPMGIHRIAVDPATVTKIERLSLGPTVGCAIKLYADAEVTQGLCIAEGLETALSGAAIIHRGTPLTPMWALGGTAGLADLPVLAGVDALTILVDHDKISPKTGERPGEAAARQCAERWAEAGREVTLLTPRREGADFNDVLREA
jgi:hypothetical protein